MTLKTYQAPTMAEALAQMKRELGRDAVILHTRNFRKGAFLGRLWGRPMWEITASPNANVPPRSRGGSYVPERGQERPTQAVQPAMPAQAPPAAAACATAELTVALRPQGEPLEAQVRQIKRMLESLLSMQPPAQGADMPAQLRALRSQLLQQEVSEEVADELVQELKLNLTGQQMADHDALRLRLAELISAKVLTADPAAPPAAAGRARVAAFIGPTGVGKTTTIAKVAANLKLREGKRVGLITIDTYRMGAADQLRMFADIIELPLQVVLTAGELRQAVDSMQDRDVVLIDTAGRSQNDRLRLSQLSGFLRAAGADEVHLVIAATANRTTVVSILERFMPLGANRIVMTKLDEVAALGAVLNVAAVGRLPLSYVTIGQDVPDDIAPADPNRLARCIVEGNRYVNG